MSGNSFRQRYLSGDRIRVWAELIQLGDAIRAEPVFSDALAVVREVVDCAQSNLETIHDRLVHLGYEFANPGGAPSQPRQRPPTRCRHLRRASGRSLSLYGNGT